MQARGLREKKTLKESAWLHLTQNGLLYLIVHYQRRIRTHKFVYAEFAKFAQQNERIHGISGVGQCAKHR